MPKLLTTRQLHGRKISKVWLNEEGAISSNDASDLYFAHDEFDDTLDSWVVRISATSGHELSRMRVDGMIEIVWADDDDWTPPAE